MVTIFIRVESILSVAKEGDQLRQVLNPHFGNYLFSFTLSSIFVIWYIILSYNSFTIIFVYMYMSFNFI